MCDAIHFAEELSGRYRDDRAGLPAIAIADPGHLSCVGNDYGYEMSFPAICKRMLEAATCCLPLAQVGKAQMSSRLQNTPDLWGPQ